MLNKEREWSTPVPGLNANAMVADDWLVWNVADKALKVRAHDRWKNLESREERNKAGMKYSCSWSNAIAVVADEAEGT